MPRVTTQNARKSCKCTKCGETIKKGDKYYKATPRYRPAIKHCGTCGAPTRSQLTGSAFLASYFDLLDEIGVTLLVDGDSVQGDLEDIAGRLEQMKDDCQGSLDNMPEGLQQGDTGQMLQERIDGLESWKDTVEAIDADGVTGITAETVRDDHASEREDAVPRNDDGRVDTDAEEEWIEGKVAELRDQALETIRDEVTSGDPGF